MSFQNGGPKNVKCSDTMVFLYAYLNEILKDASKLVAIHTEENRDIALAQNNHLRNIASKATTKGFLASNHHY